MQLETRTVLSSKFTHLPESKTLVAEVSDLPRDIALLPLYDDACDLGITLRNSRTANTTRWAFRNDLLAADGEFLGWSLVPCSESIRRNPSLHGYTMSIFND
jgi:hypothetical protein